MSYAANSIVNVTTAILKLEELRKGALLFSCDAPGFGINVTCVYGVTNSPIVSVLLALDSWNYCSGEQAQ